MDLRKSMGIGPRTRRNILQGKNIRKDEDGDDVFEDYWSENDESSSISTKYADSTAADQVNSHFSHVIVEAQHATSISAVSISKREFLKPNEAESENTTSKAPFEKNSLLLKEVSGIQHKNVIQMQHILPDEDDLDKEIMEMCEAGKKNLSRKRSLNRSKANKELLGNSKSLPEKSTAEEMRECTDELPDADDYDLELLGKKLQNASYVSPSKDFNEKDIPASSLEDTESDNAEEKNCIHVHVSPDTSNMSNKTTASRKLKKKSPGASPKNCNKINSTSHVKCLKKINIRTRSKSASISPKKNITKISLHNNTLINSPEHNRPFYKTINSTDNSFKQVSTQKRKITGKKGKENEQIIFSEHIQPINTTYNCTDNSCTQLISEKKTIGKKRTELVKNKSNITDENDLSHKKDLNISKANKDLNISKTNKELLESSKSQEKDKIEEMKECTEELLNVGEYDVGGEMQNTTYVSPSKQMSENDITADSPEDSESDAAIEKDSSYIINNRTCNISNKTTTSRRLKKKSPYASPKNIRTRSKLASVSPSKQMSENDITADSPEDSESDAAMEKDSSYVYVSPNNRTCNISNKTTTSRRLKRKSPYASPKNIHTRSKLDSVSPNKDISNVSWHNNAVTNSPRHSQPIFETDNTVDNSFKQKSTRKGNENGQVNSSEHSQPINADNNNIGNSFKQKSTPKGKTNGERGNENKQINSSEQQLSSKRRKTIVKKRNKQINFTKKQNKRKKSSLKSQEILNSTKFIRKSGRQRFPPLAHWRNERLLHQCINGEIKFIGIDKGTNEDDKAVQYIYNRYKFIQMKKKITKPKKAGLINVAENKMCTADIIKRFTFSPWNTSEKRTKGNQPYLIKRMFETEKNGFGFLQIDVNKEKPEQYMPEDDLHMTVIKGNVELTIQKNTYEVSEKDMFIIPQNCAYSIKNIGKIKALLSYVVGKFQFLESLKV